MQLVDGDRGELSVAVDGREVIRKQGDEMPTELARMDAGELFAGGMMAILLFQMAGYLIAWAAWWLRHR